MTGSPERDPRMERAAYIRHLAETGAMYKLSSLQDGTLAMTFRHEAASSGHGVSQDLIDQFAGSGFIPRSVLDYSKENIV